MGQALLAAEFRRVAGELGFELAGVAPAAPRPEHAYYRQWVAQGMAGAMAYLTGDRAAKRHDARHLLASARSVLCVGKLYKTKGELGPISRYAWGRDYHLTLREGLQRLVERLTQLCGPFDYKICVDTAPLLERAHAHAAGLGWIGKNTCLINEGQGSWFFLGELLVSLEIEPDTPPPDRCGTCRRCIDACPTAAIVPAENGRGWALDSRACLSYLTIELKGPIPERLRPALQDHLFGCDICQEVCPWNDAAPDTAEPDFQPRHWNVEELARMTPPEFRRRFADSPLSRPKLAGMLRNLALSAGPDERALLETLAAHADELVAEHARWALAQAAGK